MVEVESQPTSENGDVSLPSCRGNVNCSYATLHLETSKVGRDIDAWSFSRELLPFPPSFSRSGSFKVLPWLQLKESLLGSPHLGRGTRKIHEQLHGSGWLLPGSSGSRSPWGLQPCLDEYGPTRTWATKSLLPLGWGLSADILEPPKKL